MQDNFDLFRLFLNKEVTIYSDDGAALLSMRCPSIRDTLTEHYLNLAYQLWTSDMEEIAKKTGLQVKSSWDLLTTILFDLGKYRQFANLYSCSLQALKFLFNDKVSINLGLHTLTIGDVIMTEEIWDYVIYLLKLCYGVKVSKPIHFNTDEERQWYLAQKKNEDRIRALREKGSKDSQDAMLKIFLNITYAFPNFTFDYLFDQTMAQIHWLQSKAAGAVSYEVKAQAYAAGNMKKGSQLDFFIK